jgi:hypothetical protein
MPGLEREVHRTRVDSEIHRHSNFLKDLIMTAISDKYAQLRGAQGFLGAAITGEVSLGTGRAKQDFRNGTIYWKDSVGAFEVHGLIRDRYNALGANGSALGFPRTDELTTPDTVGRYNHFENGSIYWTPSTGAIEVFGPARARWAELRWERGLLGYPIASPVDTVRNRVTFKVFTFQKGRIEVNQDTNEVFVEKFSTGGAPNYVVPIIAFRVSDDDGSNPCAITVDNVQSWVNEANRVYAAAGVRFSFDRVLRDMKDTKINRLSGDGDANWSYANQLLNGIAARERSVVTVYRANVGGGFSWWTYDFVAMSFFDPNALNILAHELGHHFGLPHTHARGFATVREAEDYLLSGGSVASLDGDAGIINDTPPDPHISSLSSSFDTDAVSLAGQGLSLDRRNVMSYWNRRGSAHLTHGQIDRVRQLVVERKARYLNVTDVVPPGCAQRLTAIRNAQERLDELRGQFEPDATLAERQRMARAIAQARTQVQIATDRARAAGCL